MSLIAYALGKNHYDLDPDLPVLLAFYWPGHAAAAGTLREFGALAGGEAYEVAYHVDHEAHPVLVMHDLDGRRVDRVRLSPAHAALLPRLARISAPPYESGSWHHHYALGYLLADPGLYCEVTITQCTAYAIHKYAPAQRAWLPKLLDGSAFGATWMTEVQGGSDLGANRTLARVHGDGFRLDGEKYFASGCGLADVALVTARRADAPPGAKGLGLFLVPRERADGTLNFHVRRLKDKSATRAVTSGEVEFNDSEAHAVGDPTLGVYYILENLLVSRLANCVAAMGIARKAQFEALARVRARTAFGKALIDQPLVRCDLTDMAVRLAGGLALSFHAIDLFERAWHEQPPYSSAYHHARFVAHLAKNRTAAHAAHVTQLAMELFGGVGFLEEYAVARLHREALITPIWEGTSNIQALDLLEAVTRKQAQRPFLERIVPGLHAIDTVEARAAHEAIVHALGALTRVPEAEAQWRAKHALDALADATQVALLYALAPRAGARYAKLAALYARRFVMHEEYPAWAADDAAIWGGRT